MTMRKQKITLYYWDVLVDKLQYSNQTETIDVKEVYNLFVLSNPKQNDIDIGSFISISKIKGIKAKRHKTKSTSFS